MWRNGRRNGLKIRSREKRGMGSNPIIGTSQNAILLGKIVRICYFIDCEASRNKTHKKTVYLPSIRQVRRAREYGRRRVRYAQRERSISHKWSIVAMCRGV